MADRDPIDHTAVKDEKGGASANALEGLLTGILRRADSPLETLQIVTNEEARSWPVGALRTVVDLGLLRPIESASTVICPGCEESCPRPIESWGTSDGPLFRVFCNVRDDITHVDIEPDDLRRWRVDLTRLATELARLLGTGLTPRIVVRDRLWRLGPATLLDVLCDAYLIRGLSWNDAREQFARHFPLEPIRPSVLFSLSEPHCDGWRPTGPVLVPMLSVLQISHAEVCLDGRRLRSLLVPIAPPSDAAGNFIRREGEGWQARFERKTTWIQDVKGMAYLAVLLDRPGQTTHVLQLVLVANGVSTDPESAGYGGVSESQLNDEGLSISSSSGLNIDPEDMRSIYETGLRQLETEIQRAERRGDRRTVEVLKERLSDFTKVTSAIFGRDGRPRPNDASERARQSVGKAIRETIARIRRHHKPLADHLDRFIELGFDCSYNPHPFVDWTL